jgi:hypothetical protein
MKRWHLLIFFAAGILLQGLIFICWQDQVPQEAKPQLIPTTVTGSDVREKAKLGEIAKGFVENQTSIGLAALGGIAATLFAIIEKLRLTRWRQRWITLAISFFAGSLFFGYLAMGTLLRQISEIGTVLIDSGDFHVAASMQFLSIIAGALSYAALILDLIHNPQRRVNAD